MLNLIVTEDMNPSSPKPSGPISLYNTPPQGPTLNLPEVTAMLGVPEGHLSQNMVICHIILLAGFCQTEKETRVGQNFK